LAGRFDQEESASEGGLGPSGLEDG
jgi:hypothetical protein